MERLEKNVLRESIPMKRGSALFENGILMRSHELLDFSESLRRLSDHLLYTLRLRRLSQQLLEGPPLFSAMHCFGFLLIQQEVVTEKKGIFCGIKRNENERKSRRSSQVRKTAIAMKLVSNCNCSIYKLRKVHVIVVIFPVRKVKNNNKTDNKARIRVESVTIWKLQSKLLSGIFWSSCDQRETLDKNQKLTLLWSHAKCWVDISSFT